VLDRTNIPARGLAGGRDGERGAVLLNDKEPLSSKSAYVLQPHDIITFKLPGGGGYGPAGEREPALVARDIEQGYISAESAVRDYGSGKGQASKQTDCAVRSPAAQTLAK
jgi:N-methylhydantoinase B